MHINSIGQNIQYNSVNRLAETQKETQTVSSSSMPDKEYSTNPMAFTSTIAPQAIRTEFASNDEVKKYQDIFGVVDKETRRNLNMLLKNGKLLSDNSNDKSTVLDNLHKIATTPRVEGLTPVNVLQETINTIANPFKITQQFGDIPQEYVPEILQNAKNTSSGNKNLISKYSEKGSSNEVNEKNINVQNSGACVSASIEFNVAQKMPAEFARLVEGLSSPKLSVNKVIDMNKLSDNTVDSVWLLNAFEVPYHMSDFNSAEIVLKPDNNAIIRARIQDKHKDPNERSLIDVLMQSTFMNVGSQNSYNSLNDVRKGKFNQNDKGLIEFEKTFTESVVEDKNMISVTYQIIDENDKLVGYETSLDTMKRHLLETLDRGENIIIGYTQVDNTNKIINGHEITIIGAQKDNAGKTYFLCNDTDDNKSEPIIYSEDYLLPKIHHAGLPHDIAEKDVELVDNWVGNMKTYRDSKATA